MKKMMRYILFSFAILAGIVMAGVNPARADTLKDVSGNPIVQGRDYHLATLYNGDIHFTDVSTSGLGAGFLYALPQDAQGRGVKVRFYHNSSYTHYIELNRTLHIRVYKPHYSSTYGYIGPNATWGGIQVGDWNLEYKGNDWTAGVHTTRPAGFHSSFAFKNGHTNSYLKSDGPDTWLWADGGQNSNTSEFVIYPVEGN
ncbi:hypothetical protein BK704_21900 [[Bacillus thuringiensis] serovar konkukian]|nr:hypothetical protein [Bacillus thuringiensis]MED1302637.1 hypothetical protein [Bacillus pacificus]OUB00992.1 hypothetical protein BK704_21900 [[Bacillus thuringiensis] serovar konkukian]